MKSFYRLSKCTQDNAILTDNCSIWEVTMNLDIGNIFKSIELASAVTVGLVLFMGIIFWAAQPRLRYRWKSSQPACISVACTDPRQLCAHIEQALSPWGFHSVGNPNGPLTLEPSAFQKKLGLTAMTVAFPDAATGIITGQAQFVAKLNPSGEVRFVSDGTVPYRDWLRQRLAVKFGRGSNPGNTFN